MMYNNKWLPFRCVLPIYIVALLFFTCCIKFTVGLSIVLPINYTRQHGAFKFGNRDYIRIDCSNVDWSKIDYSKVNWENIDCSSVDWHHVDCSKLDLLAMNHRSNLLYKAIDSNNINMLQRLLKEIKSNPIKYPPKKIIELIACPKSGKEKIPLLIRAINRSHNHGLNHTAILELLFETLRYYDLSACEEVFLVKFGSGKYTIIHQAIHVHNSKIMVYLIEKYIKTKQDQGVEYFAALSGMYNILCTTNKNKETPLEMALLDYNFLHAKRNLAYDIKLELNKNPQEILDIVQYLVGYMQYLATYIDNRFKIASCFNNMFHEIAERCDINMLNNTVAIITERLKIINKPQYKEIIHNIVSQPDHHGRTPLHYAVIQESAKEGMPYTAAYLMRLGANPTEYDNKSISPLFIAIAMNNQRIVELLLDSNFPGNKFLASNINHQGSMGLTPLNWAVYPKEKSITTSIARLFSKVATCNPEIDASIRLGISNPEIVKTLLDAGSDVVIPDKRGNQPLHRAVQSEQVDLVEMLLKHKANPLAKGLYNYTTLDLLITKASLTHLADGNGPIMKMLLLILQHILQSVKPIIGSKSYEVNSLNLYMGLRNFVKTNDWKCEPCTFSNYLTSCIFERYGIPSTIIYDYKSKKRLLDTDACAINPKKRRRISIKECDSGSGRTQGT